MAFRFPSEVQQSVNSSAKTSHLWSKVVLMPADDRHGIDLTDWTFLLVGAVKSCGLTLWPLCPKGSSVIGHFVCTSVLCSTAGCERVHPQAAGLAGGRLPDESWRRQVTTALYIQRSLLKEWTYSRQMLVGGRVHCLHGTESELPLVNIFGLCSWKLLFWLFFRFQGRWEA